MLRLPLVFAATVLGVMLATDLAYGQPAPGEDNVTRPGGLVDRLHEGQSQGSRMLNLLRLRPVEKELSLSDEQRKRIKELEDAATRPGFGGPTTFIPPDPRGEVQIRLAEILKSPQMKRLKEIVLQTQGAHALKLFEVIEKLEITEEQQEKLGELYNQFGEQQGKIMQEHMSGALPENRQEKRAKAQGEVQMLQQKLTEHAIGVLTPEQRRKFEKMRGKAVDLTGVLFQNPPPPMGD
jgi:hypothetical protein